MFDIEERRRYMRQYYQNNKHKWINYYNEVVLPRYKKERKPKKNETFKKIKKTIILIFD